MEQKQQVEVGELVRRNVARLRQARGLTAAQVARVLGWDRSVVAKIETGRRGVSVDDLVRLAWALGVPPVALMLPHDTDGPGSLRVEFTGGSATFDGAREAYGWLIGSVSPRFAWMLNPKAYFEALPASVRSGFPDLLARLTGAGWTISETGDVVTTPGGLTRDERGEE